MKRSAAQLAQVEADQREQPGSETVVEGLGANVLILDQDRRFVVDPVADGGLEMPRGCLGLDDAVLDLPFEPVLRFLEIAGRLALAEKRWDAAIAELDQANLLNPYNRYRLSQAYAGKGDAAKACKTSLEAFKKQNASTGCK